MKPCRRAARQGILIFLASLAISAAGSLRTIETSGFILAGEDPESLLYVSQLARRGALLWNTAFGSANAQSPAVLIHLNTEDGASESGVVARFQGGKWVIDVDWHLATQRRTLSYALALGWWQRTALYAGGQKEVPAWLVAAAAALLELDLNPLFRDILWLELPGQCHEQSLQRLLNDQKGFAGETWVSALVLYESLRAELSSNHLRIEAGDWLRINVPERLSEYLPETEGVAKEQLHHVWWATVWSAAVAARRGPFQSISESQKMLSALERVTVQRDGREHVLLLGALADSEVGPLLVRFFDQRQAAAEEALKVVHPVYHNTCLSLARAYQALAVADFGAFRAQVEAFEDDRRAADKLAAEIRWLLNPTVERPAAPNP